MSFRSTTHAPIARAVTIAAGGVSLQGDLVVPADATGLVLFAHGSGSSRHSPRNKYVAEVIRDARIGTLLFDLLTVDEEAIDARTRHLRFDIDMLATRLADAARWVHRQPDLEHSRLGFFGSSTGGGAALVAAAELGDRIGAVVSRGGRPDLAGPALGRVSSPTLLIVGGRDEVVIDLNQQALGALQCEKQIAVVPGATHLFEEPGKLEAVARLAADWFAHHLGETESR